MKKNFKKMNGITVIPTPIPYVLGESPVIPLPVERDIPPHEKAGRKEQKKSLTKVGYRSQYKRTQKK